MEWELVLALFLMGINNICVFAVDITLITKEFIVNNLADVLIYGAGFLWGIELIPQIRKTYKTKNVEGLSLSFFAICLVAYVFYAIGNIMLKNWNIVISHIPSLCLFLVQLIMIIKYRKGNKNEKK